MRSGGLLVVYISMESTNGMAMRAGKLLNMTGSTAAVRGLARCLCWFA